jgi:hypothetical protein
MFDNERRTILLTLLVIALVLFAPVVVKWVTNDNSYSSGETYYNVRMVEHFDENNQKHQDVLQQRPYDFNLFHYIFAKLNVNLEILAKFIPPIFGLISLLLLYFLLKAINMGHNDTFFAIIILATTPIFLYNFTTFSPEIIVLPIFLAGLLFFVKGYYVPSAIFFGTTALLNIFYTILGLIIVVGDYLIKRKHLLNLIINSGVIFISVLLGVLLFQINYFVAFTPLLSGLNGLLIEFGAMKSYAVISMGLAILGLFSWWKKESSKTMVLIVVLVLILSSIFFESIRLPIAVVLAVFAAFSISYLANREWEIFVLKGVILLLILCILFFSAVLTLNMQTKNIIQKDASSFAFLSSVDVSDTILSVERNGFIIEYESGRRAYLDDNSYKFKDYMLRKDTANRIYYARNLRDLETLLNKERITHIIVDSDMKSGEVWNGRSEGLLFFLENSDDFIKVFYNDEVQIYRYVGKELK